MRGKVLTFAEIFRRWLGDRSPESVAVVLGTSERTPRLWINGEHLPPATKIPALAKRLRVSEGHLRRIIANDRAEREADRHVISLPETPSHG
jgi:hypothetical protein